MLLQIQEVKLRNMPIWKKDIQILCNFFIPDGGVETLKYDCHTFKKLSMVRAFLSEKEEAAEPGGL